MRGTKMPWDYIAILALLGVIVPWRSSARVGMLLESDELRAGERIALYASTMAFQWGISAVILWRTLTRGVTLAQLGLDAPYLGRTFLAAIVLTAVLVLNQVFGVKRIASMPVEKRGLIARLAEKLLPRRREEVIVGIAMVATVGICEEFIYRGFVQAIFQQRLSSAMAGAVISALFFAVAHVYQGRRGLVTTFVVGLVFSAARVWTQSLIPSMVIHFAVDLSAAVAASRMLLNTQAVAIQPLDGRGDSA